ncbi:hypothetical protein GQX74_010247 [Glossina fuscipes]|nr:hypothetical protein GQX74_010247 [Glossina fuscipes]
MINSIEFIPRDEISVLPYSEMKLSTTEKKLFKYCETSIRVFVINSDAIPDVSDYAKVVLHAVMDSTDGRMVRAPRRKRNEEQMCDRFTST